MSINMEIINMLGARLEGTNPLPYFCDRQRNQTCNFIEPFEEEAKKGYGYETGSRVLPYKKQDRYSRKRIPMTFKGVILENEYLRATFMPEMGGRLLSLFDKEKKRELLSRNSVYQPGNLANREAWFSGGIEWNVGHVGHAFHTCSDVFLASISEEFNHIRIYEYERCKGVYWQIDFHLPQGERVLYAYTRIINPKDESTSMYWWTNTAVPETDELRVFASGDDVIYIDPLGMVSNDKGFGYHKMPYLPSAPEIDSSYPAKIHFSDEYFFQPEKAESYFEAAVYKDGHMFFDMSTDPLRYRKMFCWGNHKGGKHWQDFLSDGTSPYVEIQAGLRPTQMHGCDMPGKAVWSWLQCFGSSDVDVDLAYHPDWYTARKHVSNQVVETISQEYLRDMEKKFESLANTEIKEILHSGSGWGALEKLADASNGYSRIPSGLSFPTSTITEEQHPWIKLLTDGKMPEIDRNQIPSSWMVDEEWQRRLSRSLSKEGGDSWFALMHMGVMAYENANELDAIEFWEASLRKEPSVWVLRHLAVAAKEAGEEEKAVSLMEEAMKLDAFMSDPALVEEYMGMLIEMKKYKTAWRIYQDIPDAFKEKERIMITAGVAALNAGDESFVRSIFEREFAVIREGELTLSNLWFEINGKDSDLPEAFDFRIVNG